MKPILPSIVSAAVLAAGCSGGAPREARTSAAPLATIRVQTTERPATFEAGGILHARTTATIASRVLAPVVAVHVRAGDRVRRGAPLVVLEGREMEAARARAEAASIGSEENVHAARATVETAEAALALATVTHQRIRALHDRRSATPHELDGATFALEQAQAQLAAARAGYAGAVASRDAARAAVDAASATLSYTTLAAPFDGVVTERAVEPGDMAAPGVRLIVLEDPAALQLEVTLDATRAAMVSPRQPARVWLDDRHAWIDAVVSEIERIDPASHGFLVRLDLPSTVQHRSGTFGRARFEGPPRPGVFVPASVAVRRGQLTFVYVVDDDGRVRLQPIAPGTHVDDQLEVLAGLDENTRVVRQPPAWLSDGAHIVEGGR